MLKEFVLRKINEFKRAASKLPTTLVSDLILCRILSFLRHDGFVDELRGGGAWALQTCPDSAPPVILHTLNFIKEEE